MDRDQFHQLLFISILAMQYHPRNEVFPVLDEVALANYPQPHPSDRDVFLRAIQAADFATDAYFDGGDS